MYTQPQSPRWLFPAPAARRSIGAAALAGCLLATPALAADKSWTAGDGNWFTAGNWSPIGVPAWGDDIYIGNVNGVFGSTVVLNALAVGYGHLEVTDAMTLDINGGELVSTGHAWITGASSRIIVHPAPGLNASDFQGILHVGPNAIFELADAPVTLYGASSSSGYIRGRGSIHVDSPTPFRNNGFIQPGSNGGLSIQQGDPLVDRIDLDGTTGDGRLALLEQFSMLEISAAGLSDSFSGDLIMSPGAYLNMDLAEGWSVDADGEIYVGGWGNPVNAALIGGSELSLGGTLDVYLADGHLRMLAPLTVEPGAVVNVSYDDWMEADAQTMVDGGTFYLSQGAQVDFNGPTTMRGGVFNTPSNLVADGVVDFNGATTWDGDVIINGAARQNGNATVRGPTTITAGRFDLDGVANNTTWQIDSGLTVTADLIGSTDANRFDGVMNIASGTFPRLTVNLPKGDSWVMGGTLNLDGFSPFFETRVAGSPVRIEGDVNVLDGRVRINADATFAETGGGAVVNLPANTTLRMDRTTVVRDGVVFAGEGTFQNGPDGNMTLMGGVSLGDIALVNQGTLDIDTRMGVASVDRFTQTEEGTWEILLGGYEPGTDHDLLIVTGGAALLDGTIEVGLYEGIEGIFAPQVGDEFTVLTALGGVSGVFTNDPVTSADGLTYEWTVLYGTHDVTLRLDAVTPEPAALALLSLGGLTLGRSRRRVA
jgi:hypothetical protein